MKNAITGVDRRTNGRSGPGKLNKNGKMIYRKEINRFVSHFQLTTGISPTKAGRESLKRYLHYRVMADMPPGSLGMQRTTVCRWLAKNIDQKIGIALLKTKTKDEAIRLLSLEELDLLFRHSASDIHCLILQLIYFLGLRIGEVVALKVGDVDLENRVIHFKKSKDSSKRSVKLATAICDRLRHYTFNRDRNEHLFFLRRDAATGQTRPISLRTLQLYLNRLCRKIGLGHITPQTLRGNYAIYMLRKGVSHKIIMQQMGLTSSRSILRYMRYVRETNLELPSPLNDFQLAKMEQWPVEV